MYVYCLCLKSVWWLRLSGRDFPFTVHKGAELLFHLKQTLLYLDAFTQLSVFCYWSAVEGLVARCLKCFPGFFDVPVTGFSPSSPSPRENHFSATVPLFSSCCSGMQNGVLWGLGIFNLKHEYVWSFEKDPAEPLLILLKKSQHAILKISHLADGIKKRKGENKALIV